MPTEPAFDGNSGFKHAEGKPFDLILLDIMVPGMDGLEICRRLRSGRLSRSSSPTSCRMLSSRALSPRERRAGVFHRATRAAAKR